MAEVKSVVSFFVYKHRNYFFIAKKLIMKAQLKDRSKSDFNKQLIIQSSLKLQIKQIITKTQAKN